jgi:hypothetical protein
MTRRESDNLWHEYLNLVVPSVTRPWRRPPQGLEAKIVQVHFYDWLAVRLWGEPNEQAVADFQQQQQQPVNKLNRMWPAGLRKPSARLPTGVTPHTFTVFRPAYAAIFSSGQFSSSFSRIAVLRITCGPQRKGWGIPV